MLNAQKNLKSEMVNTNAVMSEMGDKFRTGEPEEYFGKAYRSVKSYNDELAESISKFGKQTKEMKKFIPDVKKNLASIVVDFANLAKYEIFGSSTSDKFKKGIIEANSALNDLMKTNKKVKEQIKLDPKKKDDLTKELGSAYEKYFKALTDYQQLFRDQIDDSKKDLQDIYLNIELKEQPFTKDLESLRDRIKKFAQETQDMLTFNPTLDAGVELAKVNLEEGVYKNVGKEELATLRRIYDKSVALKKDHLDDIKIREKGLRVLIEEAEILSSYSKFEAGNKEMAAKGGKPIFSTEELVSVGKVFDSPLKNFTTALSDGLNKFIDLSNSLTDSIYRGFYLGIEDLKDPLSEFFASSPQMAQMPEVPLLSEGMSAMSGAMSGMMGAVSSAGMIADAIGGAASEIANLPNKIADALQAIVDMPKIFIQGLGKIVEVIPKLFSEFIPGLFDAFSELFNLPFKIVDGIFAGLMKLVDSDIMMKVGKAIFQYFFGAIPRLIIIIVKVAMGIIKLIIKIIKNIPRLVIEFIDGIFEAIKELINELAKSLGLGEVFKLKVTLDEKSLGNISEAIKNGSQQMFAVLDADGEKKGTGIMAKILAALDKGYASIKKITDGLWALWKWVRDKILMPLWRVIVGAWNWAYKNVISKIEHVVKKAWLWVWDKVLKPMLNDLKKDFLKLIGNLKSVWMKIFNTLSSIMKPILQVVGFVFKGVITLIFKVVSVIMKIMSNIGPVMKLIGKLVTGFGSILAKIPKVIADIIGGFKSFIKKIPETIKDWAQKAGKYLTAGFDKIAAIFVKIFANLNLFEILNQLFDLFKNLPEKLTAAFTWIGEFVKSLFNGVVSMFVGVFNFVKTVFNGIVNTFKSVFDVIKNIFSKITGAFSSVFDVVKTIFKTITDAFDTAFKFIKDVFDGVISGFNSAFTFVETVFNKVVSAFQGIFDFAKGVFDGVVNALSTAFSIFTPVVDAVKSALTSLGSFLKPILDGFSSIGSSIGSMFNSLDFSKMGSAIGDGFKKIIDPIIDLFKSVANAIIDVINGLKIPKTDVGIRMPPGIPDISFQLFPNIDLIPGEIARFATGGQAMGTDTIPAMLTPGEFIVNRNATAKNLDLLRNINAGREPLTSGGSSTFNITINAKTYLDQDAIKREILPTIERELKRKSLDGSFIIAASGIRK